MKITKRQLRKIIKEEMILKERMNQSEMYNLESGLRQAVVTFADKWMMSMGMNPSDPMDRKRLYRRITDIVETIIS